MSYPQWCSAVVLAGLYTGTIRAQSSAVRAQSIDVATQKLYAEAKSAEAAGDEDLAVEKYNAILKSHPRLAAAYNNLGNLYYLHGQLEQAVKPLRRAAEIDPKTAAPHALLGFVYYQMGQYRSASDELEVAVKLNPTDQVAKLFWARSLVEFDELRRAAVLLEALQQKDANNPEVLYTLGIVYSGLAKSTLGSIKTVAPDSYLVDLLLGRYAESKLLYTEAVKHYKSALEKSPNLADLHYHYAHALAAIGELEPSITEYRQALALDPYHASANWEAARLLLQTDPKESLRLSTRALKLNPTLPEAHLARGRALLALSQPKDALGDLQEAVALDPEDETAHFQLAEAYRQLGLVKEAEAEKMAFTRIQKAVHAAEKSLAAEN